MLAQLRVRSAPGAASWALIIGLAVAACDSRPPLSPGPVPAPVPVPPPAPGVAVGEWRAAAVRDAPLPGTIYAFDDDDDEGQRVVTLFIVDSATFTAQSDGRYMHRIEYSVWEGDADGRPHRLLTRYQYNDFGQWTRSGTVVSTVSGWVQNHIMTGDLGADSGALRMQHGLTPGDPPASFRYVRQPSS
jgi:hypothetical protein